MTRVVISPAVGMPVVYYPGNRQEPQAGQITGILNPNGAVLLASYDPIYRSYQERPNVPYGLQSLGHYWLHVGEKP